MELSYPIGTSTELRLTKYPPHLLLGGGLGEGTWSQRPRLVEKLRPAGVCRTPKCVVLGAGIAMAWTEEEWEPRTPFAIHAGAGALCQPPTRGRACSPLGSGHTSWAHPGSCPTWPTRAVRVHLTFGAAISGQRWERRARTPEAPGMRPSYPTCRPCSPIRKLRLRDHESLCSDLGEGPRCRTPSTHPGPTCRVLVSDKIGPYPEKAADKVRTSKGRCLRPSSSGGSKGTPEHQEPQRPDQAPSCTWQVGQDSGGWLWPRTWSGTSWTGEAKAPNRDRRGLGGDLGR